MHKQYYIEKEKVDRLVARKNQKTQWYNGIYDRYEYPVLTREFAGDMIWMKKQIPIFRSASESMR